MSQDLVRYDTSESRKLGKRALVTGGIGVVGTLLTPWIGVPILAVSGYYGLRWYVVSRAEQGKRV